MQLYSVIEKLPSMKNKLFGSGTTQISQTKLNSTRLAELINSKFNEDLVEAIKILYTLYLQNKDMSVYMSRIINLLPRDDVELKRISQILVVEFAADPQARLHKTQGDVLLLAIAPIIKDLTSFSTSTRWQALKALPLLRIPEAVPMLMASLKQIVTDKNALIRRSAALAVLKMHDISPNDVEEEEYSESVQFLFRDTATSRQALIFALNRMQKDSKLEFMHQRYFQLIKDLPSLTQFELERSLYFLHEYCLYYFKRDDPNHPDLNKLLDACELLLKLPYPGVVIGVARLYVDFPQESRIKKVSKTLAKFLNIGSESKFIILQMIHSIALKYPQYFKEHYRSLTILQIEKLYCKLLKLEILHLLIDDYNFNLILEELLYQARSSSPQLVAVAVKLLGKTIIKFPKYLKRTIRSLLDVLRSGSSETKNHVIASFCNIISTQENMLPLLAICLQNIEDISDIRYKASVIKLLRQQITHIPTIAAENLRKLSLIFVQQHENVKYEILLLSQRLNQHYQEQEQQLSSLVAGLHQYLMTLAQFDTSLLVRDVHRTLSKANVKILELPASEPEEAKANGQGEEASTLIGSLTHLIGLEMPGFRQPEYQNADVAELRKVVQQSDPPARQDKPSVAQPAQQPQQPAKQEQVVGQAQLQAATKAVDKKQQQKQIEEEVTKHYTNLDKVLNDFFQD